MSDRTSSDLWPSPNQQLLLKAAFLSGPECADAWDRWQAAVPGIEALDQCSGWLLPMLYRNLQAQDIHHGQWMKRCAYVYRHYWYKNLLMERHIATTFAPLAESGIPLVWLKGIALSVTFYMDEGARPITHVDVWTARETLPVVLDRLENSGWISEHRDTNNGEIRMRDSLGRVLTTHPQLFCTDTGETIRPRLIDIMIRGMRTQSLNPVDQLIHLCMQPRTWDQKSSLLWIADGVRVIYSQSHMDWSAVYQRAIAVGQLLAVQSSLTLLSRLLGFNLPASLSCKDETATTSPTPHLTVGAGMGR